MNPISTSFQWETFLHGGYVAFVFAVLFFGALAFRQVIDNLEVRRLKLGEDLDSYVDAVIFSGLMIAWSFMLVLIIVFYGIIAPSIYSYAFPLILGVQLLQITLRVYFQRTLIKTRGIIIRSILWDKVKYARYEDMIMVRLVRHKLYVDVRIGLPNEEVGFRIFAFSAEALERELMHATRAPILWSSERQQ